MRKKYLSLLAKQILQTVPGGLSKVRFAKILYFTHKGLVLKRLSFVKDMEFIRMPLGPVPVGFMELSEDKDIVVIQSPSSLVYDKELYTLKGSGSYFVDNVALEIQKIVNGLNNLTTSELVEIAHQEPSWIRHENGDEYFLEDDDLKISLPTRRKTKISPAIDEQHLQAKLIEGMLGEIVDESTSLEYPNSNKN
ncbi:hypothetical protein COT03_01355 [Candidatus Shapirobacteria bacterium CG07_land_8_20_14_0_80_39_18]|uniref:Antitoxin SocA-like Panacea domain-containing protein n=1 Tax=Candidatus Shapirobacteria bacterium CG07_land_8_20_14_0_80_39_18 TaxID=1974882 RepID=A0A2M6YRI7_9BACT|nr:MAG: hypothetical protein COT03_01355 [Candidatus Shapirobacteria bacterium CG07_land_8_20_14_0_80_39_18]